MDMIDQVQELYYKEKYSDAHNFGKKVKQKIKKFRKCGLERGGQFAPENIAFKVLRRNGYLGKLSDVVTNSYDRMMSLEKNFGKKLNDYLKEEEPFQKKVRIKHIAGKKRLVGLGNQKNKPPYTKKLNFKRGKSAPPAG